MRTFKLTINEDELNAIVNYHRFSSENLTVERSARIHDLTKRLNKRVDEAEDETENKQNQAEVNSPQGGGWV